MATAITVGMVGFESDDIAPIVLPSRDSLPAPIEQIQEGLICAEDLPCETLHAIGRTALKDQKMKPLAEMTPPGWELPYVARTIIAKEDHRYFEHRGTDLQAVVRAFVRNVMAGEWVEGASGITRQLVNIIFPPATEEELKDKSTIIGVVNELDPAAAKELREIILAHTIEEKYRGDDVYTMKLKILEQYLNVAYFGRGAYGLESAAWAYFGKPAIELTKKESHVLTGLLTDPSNKDVAVPGKVPEMSDPEYLSMRAGYQTSIDKSIEHSKIEAEIAELRQLRNETDLGVIPYRPFEIKNFKNAEPIGAQHFVDMVIAQVADMWQISTDEAVKKLAEGYKVETTLNTQDQAAMYGAIRNNPLLHGNLDAAGVSIEKNGKIRAMVGGDDYQGQHEGAKVNKAVGKAGGGIGYNYGSSFKLWVAGLGLANGMTLDSPVDVGSHASLPGINGSQSLEIGPSGVPQKSLLDVIRTSDNNGVTRLTAMFGLERYLEVTRKAGLTGVAAYPSSVLGAGEHTPLQAAQAFNGLLLNHGQSVEPFAIKKITDKHGTVVYEHTPKTGERFFEAHVAQQVAQTAVAVVLDGTAKGRIPPTSNPNSDGGKTGTTDRQENQAVAFSGARCIATYGGQAYSFLITDPVTRGPLEGVTSADVAGMAGAFIGGVTDAANTCDIAAPSNN